LRSSWAVVWVLAKAGEIEGYGWLKTGQRWGGGVRGAGG